MTNKAKLALVAAVAVMSFAATPAFAQSFDQDEGTGNVSPYADQSAAPVIATRHAVSHAVRRNRLGALAGSQSNFDPGFQGPVGSDYPAANSGGRTSYN